MKYDVIIIGAGPSGIFCAYELLKEKPDLKVLMIEKGRSIESRQCPKRKTKKCVNCKPCSITTGFAGAGAFSDGKLSLSPDVGGNLPEILGYAKTVQVIFLIVGLLSGAAVFLARDGFISLYNASPEAQEYSRQFINVISVTIIGTCYQAACLFGLVKSGGDISFVFKNDTIFVFGVVIPSALIAMWLGAPPWVVFACLKCDQILKCFVAVVKINRFNWMKNLTRDTQKTLEEHG